MVKETRSLEEVCKSMEAEDSNIELNSRSFVLLIPNKKTTKEEAKKDSRLVCGTTMDFFYNVTTGETSRFLEDLLTEQDYKRNNFIMMKGPRKNTEDFIVFDVKYIKSIKCLAIGFYTVDLTVGKSKEYGKREFFEKFRVYIDGQKRVYVRKPRVDETEEKTLTIPGTVYHADLPAMFSFSVLMREIVNYFTPLLSEQSKEMLCAPMIEMFGLSVNIGSNENVLLSSMRNWLKFIKYKEPVPKGSKCAVIKKLVEDFPLKPVEISMKLPRHVAFIQRVSKDVAVIRTMDNVCCSTTKFMFDKARIYVTKNDVIACRPNNFGEWVGISLTSTNSSNWRCSVPAFDQEILIGTVLEKYWPHIISCKSKNRGLFIVSLLAYPWFAPIATSSLSVLAEAIVGSENDYPIEGKFSVFFGGINVKAKKLNSIVGMNRHQIRRFAYFFGKDPEEVSVGIHSIAYVKAMLSSSAEAQAFFDDNRQLPSITNIDNKKFDAVFYPYASITSESAVEHVRFCHSACIINKLFGQKAMMNSAENIASLAGREGYVVSALPSGTANKISYSYTFYDSMKMLDRINEEGLLTSRIKKYLRKQINTRNAEKIEDLYNLIVSLYSDSLFGITARSLLSSASVDEILSSRDERKKYEYADDVFCAIHPLSFGEIAMEGIELHNFACGTIDYVAKKEACIMFIRRIAYESQPFYTVEIDESGTICRLSGFAGYFPKGNVAVLDFIKKWSKAKKIKICEELML